MSAVDSKDVVLASGEWNESTLPQVVAAGRLYILNGRGEFEQVIFAQYWRDGALRNVSPDGREIDEDGNVTRQFSS